MSDLSLSPLSVSLIIPAQHAAQRSLRRSLSLTPPTFPGPAESLAWHRRSLSESIVSTWQANPAAVAVALQLPADAIDARPAGKIKKTLLMARQMLEAKSPESARLRRWSAAVLGMSWSQSQLLQVMEEVEPMLAAAMTVVEQMAWLAVGSYVHMQALLQRAGVDDAAGAAMRLMLGVETPEGRQVDDWAQGLSGEAWRQRWGHRADFELDLARPRLAERMPGDWPQPPQETSWQPSQARQLAAQEQERVLQKAGWLQRPALRKQIDLCREALQAYGDAGDTLAHVLTAVRRWCLAAAAEGAEGDRIHQADEIFQLEIEEIKQMLTGEWHHRRHVATQIATRTAVSLPSAGRTARALGIAGQRLQAPGVWGEELPAAADVVAGRIVVTPRTSAAWTPYFLYMAGLICREGTLLSHGAAVARRGGLTMLISAERTVGDPMRVDPAQNPLKRLN
ncbi:MAG: hypothetical protein GXP37_09355 [Chloroflexi bacterium]|nr:hypothetical protein [Chloroflexota bacterium]